MQSSSASPGGGETERRQEPRASLSMAGCAWAGRSCSPGEPPLRSPWTQKSPRPRSALGALGVLARGAGGEVAATKVRGSPLELSGPARPVSSTGPADPGFLTVSLPRQHPRGRRPPRRHQVLVDRRSPGPVRKPPSPTQGSVSSPSPSAASSLPARLPRQGAGPLPQTSRGPAPRAPSRVLQGSGAAHPALRLGAPPGGGPRDGSELRSAAAQILETRLSLGMDRLLPERMENQGQTLSSQELCPQQ